MPPGGGQEGISIYGTKFVAEIDFTSAIQAAKDLDQTVKSIPNSIRDMVNKSKGYLAELTTAFNQAAAAAAAVGSGSGVGGVGVGAAAVGVAAKHSPVAQVNVFSTQPSTGTTTPSPSFVASRIVPSASLWQSEITRYRPPASIVPSPRVAMPYGGGLAPYGGNAIVPYAGFLGSPGGVPTGGSWSWGSTVGLNFNDWYYRYSNYRLGVGGYGGGGGGGMMGGGGGSAAAVPPPNDIQFPFITAGNMRFGQAVGGYAADFTGRLRSFNSRFSSVLNYQNLMRAASGLYLAQNIGNIGRYVGDTTIGEAMRLEERQTLLENALMSDKLNINRSQARARAQQLTTADYFGGMPVTAQEMGLSRVELAEQFRQLAPIVRLTARTQDEFQSGLQTGALARALLVARDPVQGTKGSMVALSELYSGGPDRFRSLALRFELPRNRLMEIEKEMGGPNKADPGQVLIQMLSEMGFGPQYLTMRAGTLAGQLDRSGALFENARVELWGSAMLKLRDNLTQINDAFETFLNSGSGERVIAQLDGLFGRITSFLTGGITNYLGTTYGLTGNAGNPVQIAQHINEYMQMRGGNFISSATGQIVSAGESFEEAARLITNKQFVQALRSPVPNPNFGLLGMTAVGTGILSTGSGLLNRMLLAGRASDVGKAFVGGGFGAGMSALGGAITASAAIPLAVMATIAGSVALGVQSRSAAHDWRGFSQLMPDIAAGAGIPTDVSGTQMALQWLRVWGGRIGSAPGRLLDNILGTGRPGPREQTWLAMSQQAIREGSIAMPLRTQAALMMAEGNDPEAIRAGLVSTVQDFIANNPNSEMAGMPPEYFGSIINTAMAMASDSSARGRIMAGVAAQRAAISGQQLVGPDGWLLTATPGSFLTEKGQADLWARVLSAPGADYDANGVVSQNEGLRYLEGILSQLGIIAENTAGLADENAFAYIRPSMAGDIFTGYIQDPDMRLTRRTSLPRGAPAATRSTGTPSYSISAGLAGSPTGGYYEITKATPWNALHFNNWWGGTVIDDDSLFGAARAHGSHMGLDFTMPLGEHIKAPYAGTVEYLTSPEDYARHTDLFPSGLPMYGNSAIFTDVAGGVLTYSHLSDQTIDLYSGTTNVRAGQRFAVQGNTGMVEAAPGGTGTHVHAQFWLPNGQGGLERVDPLFAESYYSNLDSMTGSAQRGIAVNMQVGGFTFNLGPLTGNLEQDARNITAAIVSDEEFLDSITENVTDALTSDQAIGIYRRAQQAITRRGQTP